MSAIAGISSARATDNEALIQRLLAAQRQYGSDLVYVTAGVGAAFGISPWGQRGAVRAVANGSHLLVADLRLDDRAQLLARAGPEYRRRADMELLLAVWSRSGEECLSWLAGDFAIAAFDFRTRHLTLARDPTGQMPLHYAAKDNDVAFASMPTGLLPFVGNLAIDRLSLAAAAAALRDDDPSSHFEGISRVLPGEIVRFEQGRRERKIYWTPSTFYEDPLPEGELVEGYRSMLNAAVTARINGFEGPIATHLSSGYDSSSVTATAARLAQSPDDIIAFTSAPAAEAPVPAHHWRLGDESAIAAATAAALGIHHFIVRDLSPIRSVIEQQALLHQELNIAIPNMAWLMEIRRRAAAAGATRLLTGECGNASLNAGGLYVLAEWLRQRRPLTWAAQAWHASRRQDTHWQGVLFNSFLPFMPDRLATTLRKMRFGSGPADETSFLRREWRSKIVQRPPANHANGYQARIHSIRNGNPAMIRKGGQAGEGVDETDPLADRRLVEFSLRLPPQCFYWNGVQRPLARAALADRLPVEVINLKRRGLQAADWAARFSQSDAYSMLEEMAGNSTATELFDIGRMRSAIDHWPTQDWNAWKTSFMYRGSLIAALAGGMFAVVHEGSARARSDGTQF